MYIILYSLELNRSSVTPLKRSLRSLYLVFSGFPHIPFFPLWWFCSVSFICTNLSQMWDYKLNPINYPRESPNQGADLAQGWFLNLGSHAHVIFYYGLFYVCKSKFSVNQKHFLPKLLPIAGFLCIIIFILPCFCSIPGKPSKIGWQKIINRGACLDNICSIA